MHAPYVRLPKLKAKMIYDPLEKTYNDAVMLDNDRARDHYSSALVYWAIYNRDALRERKSVEKILDRALDIVGEPEERYIRDSLMWFNCY